MTDPKPLTPTQLLRAKRRAAGFVEVIVWVPADKRVYVQNFAKGLMCSYFATQKQKQ